MSGLPSSPNLPAIIPSYPYQEYGDDPNIVAFFTAYNGTAQSYLDWFNSTPLAVYTSPAINGPLLDWIGQGIYGIRRPVFSSTTSAFRAGLNVLPLNTLAINGDLLTQSGSAVPATDDYYKRLLTWFVYGGDGKYTGASVLRKRVARFLYGVNGTDITLSQAETVHIVAGSLGLPPAPTLTSVAGGTFGSRRYGVQITYTSPEGETIGSAPSALTVSPDYLLVVDSPPSLPGATGWNAYVNLLSSNPASFIAGINSGPLNVRALNGTNKTPVSPPTKQNTLPIAIGSNWSEPSSGLIAGTALPTVDTSNEPWNIFIVIPSGLASTYFQQAFNQGLFAFPFQLSGTVLIA